MVFSAHLAPERGEDCSSTLFHYSISTLSSRVIVAPSNPSLARLARDICLYTLAYRPSPLLSDVNPSYKVKKMVQGPSSLYFKLERMRKVGVWGGGGGDVKISFLVGWGEGGEVTGSVSEGF
jgi:hypothetical protein